MGENKVEGETYMDNNNLNHNNFIPLHDQLLKQNADDIKELKDLTFGLPQTIERIEYVITKLSDNVEKFLDYADKKYQTKEMCEVCQENDNKRITAIEKKLDYAVKGTISVLIGLVSLAVKIYFGVG